MSQFGNWDFNVSRWSGSSWYGLWQNAVFGWDFVGGYHGDSTNNNGHLVRQQKEG